MSRGHGRAPDPARVRDRAARAAEAAARREYREAHPEENKDPRAKDKHDYYQRHKKDAAYRARHRLQLRANDARRRANGKNREAMLQYIYGISTEQHRALEISQNGECYICGRARKLLVDHDHITGRIRGLACVRCNSSMGSLGDSPATLRWVADQIEARS